MCIFIYKNHMQVRNKFSLLLWTGDMISPLAPHHTCSTKCPRRRFIHAFEWNRIEMNDWRRMFASVGACARCPTTSYSLVLCSVFNPRILLFITYCVCKLVCAGLMSVESFRCLYFWQRTIKINRIWVSFYKIIFSPETFINLRKF